MLFCIIQSQGCDYFNHATLHMAEFMNTIIYIYIYTHLNEQEYHIILATKLCFKPTTWMT